jgi:CDP-glycerol glycerophosphotransferase
MSDSRSVLVQAARRIPARFRRLAKRLAGTPVTPFDADIAFVRASVLFDGADYLRRHPDVASAGLDPVEHYVRHGISERRETGPWFDSADYLARNPDIAASGMNPLRHFSEHGWIELRDPSPRFDVGWYWLAHMAIQGVPGNPLLHYLGGGRAQGCEARKAGVLSPADRAAMAAACDALLDKGGCGIPLLQALSRTMLRIGRPDMAERALRDVVAADWGDARKHAALAEVLALQGKWWLVVESLEAAVANDGGRAEWFFRLGDAREAMKRYGQAAEAYHKAIELAPELAEWHYRLGYALERADRPVLAAKAYAQAAKLAPETEEVARFGIGVYHQKRGYWEAARDAYARMLERTPLDAGLRACLGMANDRLYRWAEAVDCYGKAIALGGASQTSHWHFRLGFALERLERWHEAAQAYGAATALHGRDASYWHYRHGYVLERAGECEAACEAYLRACAFSGKDADAILPASYLGGFDASDVLAQALEKDFSRPEPHAHVAEAAMRAGGWGEAERSYEAALARSSEHRPEWWRGLGLALSHQGRHREACDAFRQIRVLQRPHGVSEAEFERNEDTRISTSYIEYRDCLPIRGNVIVYESFNGSSMSCNPLAMFLELARDPRYRDFLHVWVLNDPARMRKECRRMRNVVFVAKGSDGYLRYLATAKYLINNSGFPPYFIRRPEQKYLATWHGTPLKTLGKEQKYKFYDHKRTQRNFLQATHIISPNGHTSDIQLDSYDIRPLYTGLYAETGYPRIDLTLNAGEADKALLRKRLKIDDRPVVLYAPTWRGTLDEVAFDTARLQADLAVLSGLGCQVVFRGHSLLERVLGHGDVSCTVAPHDIDTNELLSIVDVLVTDYSSVFFDYFPTGKPVVYYIYDVEEYEQERGLYFRMEEMPGFKCRTIEEVGSAVRAALEGGGVDIERRREAEALYNYRDDGKASRRAIEFFFDDSAECAIEYRKGRKRSILLHGGSFQPNGITGSFINLVGQIDRTACDVVVAMSPTTIELSQACIAQFRKLPADVYVVPRYGNVPMTLEERWLRRRYETDVEVNGEEGQAILERLFEREFGRVFGPKRFDSAIAFSGYDAFWTSILFLNRRWMRKVAYLHNDMFSEYVHKYPELARMFDQYRHADALVSVSRQTSELNRDNLASRLGIPAEKFVSCENVINAGAILAKAALPLESPEDERLFSGGPVFVNIGRLSVEKDQEKLIRAFSEFRRGNPGSRLLVLGTGPLAQHLDRVARQLGVADCVHMLGYRDNPYPYLRRADCFVLSSNHEGQPMTMLEALVLSRPVVATDIAGNRSVMEGRGGLLVENSVDGLVGGMQAFAAGRVGVEPFDAEAYNGSAMVQFHRVALGTEWRGDVNLFNDATSEHYLEVQAQLNELVASALAETGCTVSETGKSYVDGAVNFTWFIRQQADVLMSHGVADKNYYWMKDAAGNRYLDRFKAVCVPGRWMKDRIVRSSKLRFGEGQVHVVGWPRLDLLRAQQALVEVPRTSEEIRVLWAPTHDNRKRGREQKSTSTYPDFAPCAAKLGERYAVEDAPHPHNRTDKTPTVEKMLRANVVISDFGTMVYEAWALGKPVIFPIWILQDRVQRYLPGSAEAFIFENRIGYHPASYEEMLEILARNPVVTPDVDAFMDEYLDNYRGGESAPKLARVLAELSRG